MSFNLAKLRKVLKQAKLVKIVQGFEETISTYTPSSLAGQVIQRVTSRIASLTPTLGASALFIPASGVVNESIAFDGFIRRFNVFVDPMTEGSLSRNSSEAPYRVDIVISIGYPEFPTTKIGASSFRVADLKKDDSKQIDALMFSDVFSNPSLLSATTVELVEWREYDETTRRGTYSVELVEAT